MYSVTASSDRVSLFGFGNLATSDPLAAYSGLLIVLLAFCGMFFWFRPRTKSLIDDLAKFSDRLRARTPTTEQRHSGEHAGLEDVDAVIREAWISTEKRLIEIPEGPRSGFYFLGAPSDLWNAQRLLSKKLNLGLADAVPNVLVGLGLLLTFFFLTQALLGATGAFGGNSTQLQGAMQQLLSNAGGKFITSLAGLGSSIAWTLWAKHLAARLEHECEQVIQAIEQHFSFSGAEAWAAYQFETQRDHQEQSLALSQELLNAAEEQSASLKRFETDLAVSIANALDGVLKPQFTQMTEQFVSAVTSLSAKMSTISQEALDRMAKEHANAIQSASEKEMKEFRNALLSLSEKLTLAGADVEKNSRTAADALSQGAADAGAALKGGAQQAADGLADSVKSAAAVLAQAGESAGRSLTEGASAVSREAGEMATALRNGASSLTTGASAFASGAEKLGALLTDASVTLSSGLSEARQILQDAQSAATNMTNAAGAWAPLIDSQKAALTEFESLGQRLRELVAEINQISETINERAPTALQAVNGVVLLLTTAVKETESTMRDVRNSMQSTSESLRGTVASITEGVSQYTNKLAELHRSLDSQVAKAIGALDGSVQGIGDAIEELEEVLTERVPRA